MSNSWEIYPILNNLKNNTCMYKDCVSKNLINSHLISKWILKNFIVDYHVIAESNNINSNCLLEKKGWMLEGVTFKLFCSEHDNKLFECIEKNNINIHLWNEEQIKTLNYRTNCAMLYNYELGFKKISHPKYNKIIDSKYKFSDAKKLNIKKFKNNLKNENNKFFSNVKPIFEIYKFDYQSNVLFSSVLNNTVGNFDFYFYLLSNNEKTNSYFIISTYDSKNPAFIYVKNTLTKLSIADQKIFITNLILGHGTNGIFYNVNWWNNNLDIQKLYIKNDNYYLNLNTFRIDREKYKGFNFWN